MIPSRDGRQRLGALILVLALASGCDRNAPVPFLVPTGIRPPPAIGQGTLIGRILYDPQSAPDLGVPPFPLTIVEVRLGDTTVVAIDTLDVTTSWFEFSGLRPGNFTVRARSRLFNPGSVGPIRVVSSRVDAGDLVLGINSGITAGDIHLVGSFNGFNMPSADQPDSLAMFTVTAGLWIGPNIVLVHTNGMETPGDSALVLSPGTYQIRFVTNLGLDDDDYGGTTATVFDAPIANAPVRITGPGNNLSVRIPSTGRYRFLLDERRETFTVQALPTAGPLLARRRQ